MSGGHPCQNGVVGLSPGGGGASFIFLLADGEVRDPFAMWGAIGVGVFTVVYVVFIRPLRAGKKKDPLSRPPAAEPGLARQRSVERDMSNLLVELSDMARQMTAQLDTRAVKLEALLREAEEKIAHLQRLGGREAHGVLAEAKLTDPDVFQPPVRHAPEPQLDPRYAAVYDLADEGHNVHEIARQTGTPRGEVELILALRGK